MASFVDTIKGEIAKSRIAKTALFFGALWLVLDRNSPLRRGKRVMSGPRRARRTLLGSGR